MPNCSVTKCDYKISSEEAKSKGLKYQSFPLPTEPKLRESWLKKLNIKLDPNESIYICHRHFEDDAFKSPEDNKTTRGKQKLTRSLKPLAYPTLFLRPSKSFVSFSYFYRV